MEPGLIAKQVEFSDQNVLDIMGDLVSEILVLAGHPQLNTSGLPVSHT